MIYTVEIDWADDTHYVIGLASSLQGAQNLAQEYRDSCVKSPEGLLQWTSWPPDDYIGPPEMSRSWVAYWRPATLRYTIMEWTAIAP